MRYRIDSREIRYYFEFNVLALLDILFKKSEWSSQVVKSSTSYTCNDKFDLFFFLAFTRNEYKYRYDSLGSSCLVTPLTYININSRIRDIYIISVYSTYRYLYRYLLEGWRRIHVPSDWHNRSSAVELRLRVNNLFVVTHGRWIQCFFLSF